MRKLKRYRATKYVVNGSKYNKETADNAVAFIECLKHTKGEWYGETFELVDWQEQIVRDVFGILKPNGYRQFNTAYVEIPKKQGKELFLSTLIPTPDGLITMGEIKVGDTVFDEQGQQCNVIAKSEVDYSEQAYRITFKDGAVIEAGENHQWFGEWHSNNKRKSGVINTSWLYNRSLSPSRKISIDFRIPIAAAIETPEANLPVEPYLFGYWLGNGSAREPRITIKTDDIAGVLRNIYPHHQVKHIWDNIGDSVNIHIPDLKEVLLTSFRDKLITPIYLRSSKVQRLRLLQGLMDSDGAVSDRKGQAIYISAEKPLAESVSELLWSLGIKNAISKAPSTQRADWSRPSVECGRIPRGETLYYVKFTAFDDLPVSGIFRKLTRSVTRNPRTRSHYRYIDLIEPIPNNGMQCIQVDSPSHLYLAGRSFIPTHNSELAAAVALLLTCGDFEHGGEVYGCASDRQQASIVFDVACGMVEQRLSSDAR